MKKFAALVLAFGVAASAFAGQASAATVLDTAVEPLIGIKYSYGGTTTKGFDCSGFTSYVFANTFNIELPRRSVDQAQKGIKVEPSELRAGDLVFYNTSGKGISHVGIYLGDGQFVHSSTTHGVIINSVDDDYYSKRYVTARRVLTEEEYQLFATEQLEESADESAPAEEQAVAVTEELEEAFEVVEEPPKHTSGVILSADISEDSVPVDPVSADTVTETPNDEDLLQS